MADRHDTVALAWVKGAIDESLGLARQALEQFASEPGEQAALRGFSERLHQVFGCLEMLELKGAALLAEEMQQLAAALADGRASSRGEALGALFRGLEQLPVYLERLRSARGDLPLVALPLLNQLRAARGAEAQRSLLDAAPVDQGTSAAAELANFDLSLGTLRDQLHAGPDRDAMRSVVAALRDDLVRIKERLDLFVRGDRGQLEELHVLIAPLRQIADALAVLGFAQPRRVIIDQVAVLQGLAQGQQAPEDALLMDVAGALLYVEATLGGMVGSMESVGQSPLPGTELAEIRQLVLDECHGVLLQAKDLIADCLEAGWDRQRLQPLPALFSQIRGALAMLMLPRPAALVQRCNEFAGSHLMDAEDSPDAAALEHFADAICSLECYLQGLSIDPLADLDGLLGRAENALGALGFPTLPAPLIEPQVLALEDAPLDDELREIFLEEAEEVLQQLEEHWKRWRADTRLRDALVELRRGFHTLKGSGRMVRAQVLAELAWAAEHLLNRMLEGRVGPGREVFALLEQALALLPPLLLAFAEAQAQPRADVERLANSLHALAMNDPNGSEAPAEALDPQLLEIFRNEALTHLATLDEYLQGAEEHLPAPVSDNLQRALHTLKGSAAMAGVTPIAELAGALDLLAREFKAHQLGLDLDEIYLLQMAEPLLRRGLDQLGSAPLASIGGADILIEQVDQVVEARLKALLDAPSHGLRLKRDPQLIASFLAQGMDILLDAESLLLRWQEHPGERQELTALLDELTTLGQSAHLADLWQVDELCEALLDLYGAVEESSLAVNQRFFLEAQHAHEALIDMLDQIAAGQEVDPRPERLHALRELLDESLDPSAVGLVSSQGAQPLSITELAAATRQLEQPTPDREMELLFLEEAVDILENADQALQRWLEEPDNASALSSLQQELDTLKGGAQMAEVGPVEVLAQELEMLYAGLVDRRYSLSPALAGLLKGSHALLARMLGQLQQGEAPAAVVEQLARLREFRHTAAPGVQEKTSAAPAQEGDKELLEIFLEEGFDIVESAGAALIRWQAEPRNTVEVENLLRDLHTLKGGARMVEIAPIGDLAHELEFLYEHLAAGQLQPSPALFSLLQNCHDRLAHMLDAVRLQQPLHAATALIDYIRNFSSAALSDSAAALPSSEPALAEAPAAAPERGPADMVKVNAELLDDLGNLAGENSIIRGRIEQQVNDAQVALSEMETTLERMRDQLRRLDTETQGRILSRQQSEGDLLGYDDFDPLEMDRHSQLQQLSRALFESASDLLDLKETLTVRAHDAHSLLQQQARVNSELQEGLMRTRMVPFERLVPRLQRVVRQVASELGKQVELVVGNAEGEMDRSVLERMVAPLEHMLRNAVDHGMESREARLQAGKPEQGLIALNLLHEGADIVIEMSDDGAGVSLEAVRNKAIKRGLLDPASEISDYEVMQFILQPGFSTAEKITQISGRGLGMDVVHEEVKQLGGSMVIDSVPGKGARFLIRLPFTVSVNRALMVHYADEQYAVPLNAIEGVVRVLPAELEACYQLDPPRYEYAGHRYELRYLGEMLQREAQPRLLGQTLPLPVLLVHAHDQAFAVQVDSLAASREIVVKSLGPQFAAVHGLAGATLLGDGRVVLILDLLAQLRGLHLRLSQQGKAARLRSDVQGSGPARPLLVLVVDDSVTVRKVTGRLLERHGMNVLTAKDGVDAMAVLEEHRPDVMLLDIEMPRMDGFEVATLVRQDPRLHELPIIMITSRTGQKHRDRAMAIGVNDYLGKPYHESVLLESIARWSTAHA